MFPQEEHGYRHGGAKTVGMAGAYGVCVCVEKKRERQREIEGEAKPRLDRYGEAVWMEKRVQISEPLGQ